MKILFSKYEGTGNDFIMIDDREKKFPVNDVELVNHLCNRRFGIGADGLILLQQDAKGFNMIYYNADGNLSSMCGNGGRCFTAYANALGLIKNEISFTAADGPHLATITDETNRIVKLKMGDVSEVEVANEYVFLDTGSPHYVEFVEDVMKINVVEEGRRIRYNERFKEKGTNVNFVQVSGDGIKVRTYERGVEDETLSCGTGATAAAIAAAVKGIISGNNLCSVQVMGGNLKVYFEKTGSGFKNVFLEGPATFVFQGECYV